MPPAEDHIQQEIARRATGPLRAGLDPVFENVRVLEEKRRDDFGERSRWTGDVDNLREDTRRLREIKTKPFPWYVIESLLFETGFRR